MGSEKVKEIKKALETCMHTRVSSCRECPYNYTNTKTKHSECFRMAEHALTLINELEKENVKQLKQFAERLKEKLGNVDLIRGWAVKVFIDETLKEYVK